MPSKSKWARETSFPDEGCALGGPSCLNCRLPYCSLDISPRLNLSERDAEIIALRGSGASPFDVAAYMRLSERQVQRICQQAGRLRRQVARNEWKRQQLARLGTHTFRERRELPSLLPFGW